MVKAEQDAKNFIATLDIKRILDLFEMTETETMDDPAVSIMRGWCHGRVGGISKILVIAKGAVSNIRISKKRE